MEKIKYILLISIFLLCFSEQSFSYTKVSNIANKCREEIYDSNSFSNINKETRKALAYCNAGVRYEDDWDEFFKQDTTSQEKLFKQDDINVVKYVSVTEHYILKKKKSEKGELGLWEARRMVEIEASDNCGWLQDDSIILCVEDDLIAAYKEYVKNPGTLWAPSRKISSIWVWFKNWFIWILAWLTSAVNFSDGTIDELPEIPYKTLKDIYDTDTIFWIINAFACWVLAIILLLALFKKWIGIDKERFRVFLLKFILLLLFLIAFPYIYEYLRESIEKFEQALTDSISKVPGLNYDLIWKWIKLEMFSNEGITSLTILSIPIVLINSVLLFLISIIISIRDIFLVVTLNIVFLASIWLMLGNMSEKDIFSDKWALSKFSKFLTKWMFYILAVFVASLWIIFVLKSISIFFWIIPSMTLSWWQKMIDWITSSGIDALLYVILIFFVIYKLYIPFIKWSYEIISNFFIRLFFSDNTDGSYTTFTTDIAHWYKEVKHSIRENLEENSFLKWVKDKVEKKVEQSSNNSKVFKKSIEWLDKVVSTTRKWFSIWWSLAANTIWAPLWIRKNVTLTSKDRLKEDYTEQLSEIERAREELKEVSGSKELKDIERKNTLDKRLKRLEKEQFETITDLEKTTWLNIEQEEREAEYEKAIKSTKEKKTQIKELDESSEEDKFKKYKLEKQLEEEEIKKQKLWSYIEDKTWKEIKLNSYEQKMSDTIEKEEDLWKVLKKSMEKKKEFFLWNFDTEDWKLKEKQALRDVAKLEIEKSNLEKDLEKLTWETYSKDNDILVPEEIKKEFEEKKKTNEEISTKEKWNIQDDNDTESESLDMNKDLGNDIGWKDPIADYDWQSEEKKKSPPKRQNKYNINL